MAEPDLFESAWDRARGDAARVYRSATFALSLVIFGLLAAALASLETPGHADTKTVVLLPLAFGLGAVATTCLTVLLFEIAAAPLRQRNELRRAWPIQEPINLDLALRNLRRRGRGLLAGLGTPDFHLAYGEVENWTSEVVNLLGVHGEQSETDRFLDIADDAGEQMPVPVLQNRLAALDAIVKSRERAVEAA